MTENEYRRQTYLKLRESGKIGKWPAVMFLDQYGEASISEKITSIGDIDDMLERLRLSLKAALSVDGPPTLYVELKWNNNNPQYFGVDQG